jgi:hypothetical protein
MTSREPIITFLNDRENIKHSIKKAQEIKSSDLK